MKSRCAGLTTVLLISLYVTFTILTAAEVSPVKIETKQFGGKIYVKADSLGQNGIAIKEMPGEQKLAICTSTRCALVSDYIRDEKQVWLGFAALESVGVKFTQAEGNWRIETQMIGERETATNVGSFAPPIEFTLLDGKRVRLSDFIGKRVLINSWASW
jgi:hypothetical protein